MPNDIDFQKRFPEVEIELYQSKEKIKIIEEKLITLEEKVTKLTDGYSLI